jgi:hypothetical protein
MSILLPYQKVRAAYRVVTMPRRVMQTMKMVKVLGAKERALARAAETHSKAAHKMVHDELKLAGKGPASQLELGKTPPKAAPHAAGKAPPAPATPSAKPLGPLAQAAERNLKEIKRLDNLHRVRKWDAEQYLKDARLIQKLNNDHHKRMKFNAACNRLEAARKAFSNAKAGWTAHPHSATAQLAAAARELETAFGEFLAAVA